jgi:hypothetical protein
VTLGRNSPAYSSVGRNADKTPRFPKHFSIVGKYQTKPGETIKLTFLQSTFGLCEEMAGEPLWESAKTILSNMRCLIQSGSMERVKESELGWQYRLLEECIAMKADIEARGHKVCIILPQPFVLFILHSSSRYSIAQFFTSH